MNAAYDSEELMSSSYCTVSSHWPSTHCFYARVLPIDERAELVVPDIYTYAPGYFSTE